jgi:hypothetical protein
VDDADNITIVAGELTLQLAWVHLTLNARPTASFPLPSGMMFKVKHQEDGLWNNRIGYATDVPNYGVLQYYHRDVQSPNDGFVWLSGADYDPAFELGDEVWRIIQLNRLAGEKFEAFLDFVSVSTAENLGMPDTGNFYVVFRRSATMPSGWCKVDWLGVMKLPSIEDAPVIGLEESTVLAAFSADDTTPVTAQAVKFTDASIGEDLTYAWQFGDGDTSTEQNPNHEYRLTGTYTVTLTVTGGGNTDAEVKTDYIVVSARTFTDTPMGPMIDDIAFRIGDPNLDGGNFHVDG